MSTEKRVYRCSRTVPAPPAQETLPIDLLLEIVALADITTLVLCAATGRIIRRAILDPAFQCRLALAALDGFDPTFLLPASFWCSGNVTAQCALHTHTTPTKLPVRLDAPVSYGAVDEYGSK
jgi:hypothetical protein